jgi:hypothetical protein
MTPFEDTDGAVHRFQHEVRRLRQLHSQGEFEAARHCSETGWVVRDLCAGLPAGFLLTRAKGGWRSADRSGVTADGRRCGTVGRVTSFAPNGFCSVQTLAAGAGRVVVVLDRACDVAVEICPDVADGA